MARRFASPGDFELVGLSSDPTPGDPDQIQGIVQRYADIGDAAEKALNVLKKDGSIAAGRGSAIDKLKEKVGEDLPGKLQKTAQSYHDAADAYRTYIPRLREAQETFDRAVDQARSAAPQAGQVVAPLAPEATEQEKADAQRAQQGIDAAKGQMSAARSLAEQAQSMREAAERTAADALDRAASEAIPARNIFQKIADFFKDFPFVQILLGLLIAAVAVFFPVAGLLLGASLFAVTQIAAIASGNFKLGDFLVGLIQLVPGGSILKGIGAGAAVVGKALPGLAKTVKGSITGITSSIKNSKTIGPQVTSTGGQAVVGGTKGAVEGTVDEVVKQGLNGEGFEGGAIAGAGATGAIGKARGLGFGRKDDADTPPPVPPKDDVPPPIPVKTAPGGGTGSRSLDGGTGSRSLDGGTGSRSLDGGTGSRSLDGPATTSRPATPDLPPPNPNSPEIPSGFKASPDNPLVFTSDKFPGREFELTRTNDDDFLPPVFRDKGTGEEVFFDLDRQKFAKFTGDFDNAPVADLHNEKAPVTDISFNVKGFVGQDLQRVEKFADLQNLPRNSAPVLVPIDEISKFARTDPNAGRLSNLDNAFTDGTVLDPVQVDRATGQIIQGNHRIITSGKHGKQFVPVVLV